MTSDETLDAAAMAAMREEFLDFYGTEHDLVVRYVKVMRPEARLDEARDATQEAFVHAWKQLNASPHWWETIRHRRAWIRTVALNKYIRPPGPRRQPVTLSVAEVPEAPADDSDHAEFSVLTTTVLAVLDGFSEEEKAVMALSIDEVPAVEIAELLMIGDQRVRDIRKKCRKILAQALRPAREAR
jgi:RNA polymerase sigma factor (sigma-70 family)